MQDMEFSPVVQCDADIQFYEVVPTMRIRPKSKNFINVTVIGFYVTMTEARLSKFPLFIETFLNSWTVFIIAGTW